MKFIYKGKFKDFDDLPKADLPEHAVIYDEPDDMEGIAKAAYKLGILVLIPCVAAIVVKAALTGVYPTSFMAVGAGCIVSLALVLPHEFLHGICFPRDAQVEIWTALKQGMLFVTSATPMTKKRFVWLSLFPNICFGFVPMILYLAMPQCSLGDFMMGLGLCSISCGGGDYMNVCNTIKQVPAGAMVAFSWIHTYWWEDENDSDTE